MSRVSITYSTNCTKQVITLQIVTLADAMGLKHSCVLLPKRWVVERSVAWTARFRRLARL